MQVILLSGGSGKRLWPLSNDVRSKQFIKIFDNEHGELESMLQRVYRQIQTAIPSANITIATGKKQVSAIYNQLGLQVRVSVEPERRDTFPAIALAVRHLADIQHVDENEVVLVCPVDACVEIDYFRKLKALVDLAESSEAHISLLGIEPTYPSEKYGYIIPKSDTDIALVKEFKEKPDEVQAKRYISQGALWNAGVFAFKLKYLLDKAKEMLGFDQYDIFYRDYHNCPRISFDYAVVENEPSIQVMRFSGKWKDIGTWNTFSEEMNRPILGNGMQSDSCNNVNVINELAIPIVCVGMKDVIIAASVDGILVSDKEESGTIKKLVESLEQPAMFAEKSWGTFCVLDMQKESLTAKLCIKPGCKLKYHSHEFRDEVWTITQGKGIAVIDGNQQSVDRGTVIRIKVGCKHTIIAESELHILETQIGTEISSYDKTKYEY